MYVPNGSGLFIPESYVHPNSFSVPDGTGYVKRISNCKDQDKLIKAGHSSDWDTFGSGTNNADGTFWPAPPYAGYDDSFSESDIGIDPPGFRVTSNQRFPVIADSWAVAYVNFLTQACPFGCTGAFIGVTLRFNGVFGSGSLNSTSGAFGGFNLNTDGTLSYVAGNFQGPGTFNQTINIGTASFSTGGPMIMLKVIGQSVFFYRGQWADWILNTMTLIGSFSVSLSAMGATGRPGAVIASASLSGGSVTHDQIWKAQVQFWLAAEIGTCTNP